MRFRSELLQPPKGESEAFLTKIYDVYRSPDGHIAGDEVGSPESTADEPTKAEPLPFSALGVRNSRSRFKTAISEF